MVTMVKVFDPDIEMEGDEFEVADEAAALAEVMRDGEWLAGTNSPVIDHDPNAEHVPMPWGVAKYSETFYLWSGPYAEDGGTTVYQVDTFTIGGS